MKALQFKPSVPWASVVSMKCEIVVGASLSEPHINGLKGETHGSVDLEVNTDERLQRRREREGRARAMLKREKCSWLDTERDVGSIGVKVSGLKQLKIGKQSWPDVEKDIGSLRVKVPELKRGKQGWLDTEKSEGNKLK